MSPRAQGAYGRPNTPWLPPQWREHNARTAERSHMAVCEIRLKGTQGEYDPVTHTYPDAQGTLLYSGPCKVQRVNRENVQETGEQQVTVADYMVSINDPTAAVRVGAIVRVVRDDYDPLLVARPLSIVNVLVGSLGWNRHLFVNDNQG